MPTFVPISEAFSFTMGTTLSSAGPDIHAGEMSEASVFYDLHAHFAIWVPIPLEDGNLKSLIDAGKVHIEIATSLEPRFSQGLIEIITDGAPYFQALPMSPVYLDFQEGRLTFTMRLVVLEDFTTGFGGFAVPVFSLSFIATPRQ